MTPLNSFRLSSCVFTLTLLLTLISPPTFAGSGTGLSKLGHSWEVVQVDPSGVDPFPLDSFSACAFRTGQGGYLFGGGSDNLSFPAMPPFANFTNNLYRWRVLKHPTRIKFELVSPIGAVPSVRGFPEIACSRSRVFLYAFS